VTTLDDPSDRQLWDEAGQGSGSAFAVLFDRHSRAVYNHCFRLTGSWSAAEDHVQATFLHAWRKRREVRIQNASALPWLLAVATNVIRSERRSFTRRLAVVARFGSSRVREDEVSADHADAVAARLDDERRMAQLLPALNSLPRAEREAVALCLWSGVSYADAAAVLGIAESSVRARVSRARSRLAERLAEHASISQDVVTTVP
jgi:RNA polymerase sigma-70 factor (ECF subfamily)